MLIVVVRVPVKKRREIVTHLRFDVVEVPKQGRIYKPLPELNDIILWKFLAVCRVREGVTKTGEMMLNMFNDTQRGKMSHSPTRHDDSE